MSVIVDKNFFRATLARKVREERMLNENFYNIAKPAIETEAEKDEIKREIGHVILLATEFLTREEFLSVIRDKYIQLEYRDACFYRGLFLNHARHNLREDEE